MTTLTAQALKTVAFHTLGCKLNFAETSSLGRLFEQEGYRQKKFEDGADIYVVNTCSVTAQADKECRYIVRKIQTINPDALIVITGCYAQLKPDEIKNIKGVDLIIGAREKFNMIEHIKQLSYKQPATVYGCDLTTLKKFESSFSVNDRTRTYLKVQDGCNYNCSFCTIPRARGMSRSDTIDGVVRQAKALGEKGVQEIVLTGINLGDFGQLSSDTNRKNENFLQLIQALEEVETIARFRISSIEPNLLSPDIIQWVAQSKKIMPHFHIPLQSGSNKILGLMRRRYKKELYHDRVAMIKALMPHACIGVDVIVGFPGEDTACFEETYQFLYNLPVSYFHVFTYSERDHTLAISLPDSIPINIRKKRNHLLTTLSYAKMQDFTMMHIGQNRPVLFERAHKNDMMEGYTDNYIRIQTSYREDWVNQIINWKIV